MAKPISCEKPQVDKKIISFTPFFRRDICADRNQPCETTGKIMINHALSLFYLI